ncbi:NADH-FMN oxidoreductase RutF, flavin reductase (DIM6/NTAB) family [Gracilibacillus orientalis]|uniref:NADH-FMN oxidoreductase RutF, flavin reductase (DIM6/NTAB) family n=1 Tax=Gracilibacillus orientalis TaxID=334253 RepID=A0A1I4Q3Y7_9BACI|nr:flavin reductase family protein [Gracilibacillus orientalis]SFM34360.1 NADH-FMN oxidoreductase RutF, flavin reductase (DIM6/NTAB) family [Gracilibacillus orientalis]
MLTIDPSHNTERENYKLLIGSIIPRPIAFVTSQSAAGVVNGAPFSYFNIVSSKPPMISIAIQRSNNKLKDTSHNILHSKEFVVHIVDEENVTKINQTAASLPPDESEIELANLHLVDSSNINVPGIKESKIRMECMLEHHLELGDNDTPSTDLIIAKIIAFHVAPEIYHDGKIDPIKLAAVSRLAGQDYAKVGDIFTIERPK